MGVVVWNELAKDVRLSMVVFTSKRQATWYKFGQTVYFDGFSHSELEHGNQPSHPVKCRVKKLMYPARKGSPWNMDDWKSIACGLLQQMSAR